MSSASLVGLHEIQQDLYCCRGAIHCCSPTLQYKSKCMAQVSLAGLSVTLWSRINPPLDHKATGFCTTMFASVHSSNPLYWAIHLPSSATSAVCMLCQLYLSSSNDLSPGWKAPLYIPIHGVLIATKTWFNSCCQIEIWFTHSMLWLENKRLFSLSHDHVLQHICCRSYRTSGLAWPALHRPQLGGMGRGAAD